MPLGPHKKSSGSKRSATASKVRATEVSLPPRVQPKGKTAKY